jgi:hypothetical protein
LCAEERRGGCGEDGRKGDRRESMHDV